MRSHALRLYVFSITLLLFFVLWAVIAARPWASAQSAADPRIKELGARARQLRHEARVVEKTVHGRWTAYRIRLRAREALIRTLEQRHAAALAAANAAASRAAAYQAVASRVVTLAPQVRVVTLPPAGPSTSSGSSHP